MGEKPLDELFQIHGNSLEKLQWKTDIFKEIIFIIHIYTNKHTYIILHIVGVSIPLDIAKTIKCFLNYTSMFVMFL